MGASRGFTPTLATLLTCGRLRTPELIPSHPHCFSPLSLSFLLSRGIASCPRRAASLSVEGWEWVPGLGGLKSSLRSPPRRPSRAVSSPPEDSRVGRLGARCWPFPSSPGPSRRQLLLCLMKERRVWTSPGTKRIPIRFQSPSENSPACQDAMTLSSLEKRFLSSGPSRWVSLFKPRAQEERLTPGKIRAVRTVQTVGESGAGEHLTEEPERN